LILRGLRPFVDFIHHQPPLHLYLLALSGKLFGQTLFGYRMLSLLSVAGSGFLLFCLTRPFVGPLPALVAQAVFLFSLSQKHALSAVAESPMLLFTLLGALFLFVGSGRLSAYASGVAFVVALLIKPNCLVIVLAAVLSLVYARAWRRLVELAASGVVAATAGLAWAFVLSDGIFADILRFQVERLGTRSGGMWSIDSGFADVRRLLGVNTPGQWALYCFKVFCLFPWAYLPMSFLVISALGLPVWVTRCARSRPALQAFTVLWPVSYILLNFVALDFVAEKSFIPFPAFSSFLLAGLVWLALRYVSLLIATLVGILGCAALVVLFASSLSSLVDPGYYGRAAEITHQHPTVVSFSPMLFAATGAEPGCGFGNPALTYGSFGETVLGTARTHRFRFSDDRLIECLRAHPETPVVIDAWFYFFTRPGSALRKYLRGEGSAQVLFFSAPAGAIPE
jgi:4-amino-4-deoxy-L-arabinose transferase-like glycosyltransferase